MIRKKVLVVGSAGFIGSRLMNRKKFDECDLRTGQDIRNGVDKDYDFVVFLAADLSQGEDSFAYNLELYTALVRAFAGQKHPHIIYTSSAAVYGEYYRPIDVFDGTLPKTLYGKAKLLGEEIISSFFENYTILRLSNVVGNGDGHGVSDIIQNGGRIIYGNGEQVRDYIHVEKVVSAILSVIKSPKKHNGLTYNISSGFGQTVNEVFASYSEGQPVYEPSRDFDITYSVLDNIQAKDAGLL